MNERMKEPTDEQLNRLHAAITETMAALKDANRATLRMSKHISTVGDIFTEIATYMKGDV